MKKTSAELTFQTFDPGEATLSCGETTWAKRQRSEGLILENSPSIIILTSSTLALKEGVLLKTKPLVRMLNHVDCPFRLIFISCHLCLASR